MFSPLTFVNTMLGSVTQAVLVPVALHGSFVLFCAAAIVTIARYAIPNKRILLRLFMVMDYALNRARSF